MSGGMQEDSGRGIRWPQGTAQTARMGQMLAGLQENKR